jgi:WD40 repeat protein
MLITCGKEPVIRLWDARTGESRGELRGHTSTVEDIDWHPDGDRLVSASEDATARLFDVDARESVRIFDADTWRLSEVALSPDGQLLAAASMDSVLTIWHLEQGKVSLRRQFLDPIDRLCFDPRGERLFIATRAGIVQALPLSRAEDGRTLIGPTVLAWRAHPDRSYVLAFAPDGQSLITAGHDGRVVLWDTTDRTAAKTREFHCPDVRHFAFEPTAGRLVAAGSAGVHVWNTDQPGGEPVIVDGAHSWSQVAVSSRGDLFAASDGNGLLRTWSFEGPTSLARLQVSRTEGDGLSALDFSRDGRMLAAAEFSGPKVLVFNPITGATLHQCEVGQARVAAFSPTEDVLALSPQAHTLQLRRPPFNAPEWESEPMPNRPGVLAFSPDGQHVLVGSDERVVRVWDRSNGRCVHELRGHRAAIQAISVAPDNRTIATLCGAGLLKLWHMATGQMLLELETGGRDGLPQHCAFSPDGHWLAWAAERDVVRLLRLK